MYAVEVQNGLYDTKRGRRKMGRDTSLSKLLLCRRAHIWSCKDGNYLANSKGCGKAD